MSLVKYLLIIVIAIPTLARRIGQESDSGTVGPKYADLVAYFGSLPQKYPGLVQVNQFGQTPNGRPLIVIKVSYPQRYLVPTRNTKTAILMTGATHGNEYLGIEDRLPEWFAKEGSQDPVIADYFKTGGSIYFIPIYNPDGYEARRRENSRGVDLNRDFSIKQAKYAAFKEIESQSARDMLATQLNKFQEKLLITMDYHCCIGAALYPWSFEGAPGLPATDLALFTNYGSILKGVFGSDFRVGQTPIVLGYSAVGTSKDYYYETYGAMSFTYEGEVGIEKNKMNQHILMWKRLIQYGQLTRSMRTMRR